MACIDMFNTDHQGLCTPMSPRISFSNDFIDTTHDHLNSRELTPPLASSEHFEFSVSKYTMMPADELFFKGTLLPFKKTTLRDELLVDDHDEEDVSVKPPKVPTKWKEFWGLKKSTTSNIVNKKVAKINTTDESMGKIVEMKGPSSTLVHEEIHISKISQEFLSDRESLNRDVEMRI